MKKILAMLLTMAMVFAFAACSSEEPTTTATDSTPAASTETTSAAAEETTTTTEETATADLSGDVTISGSTSVEKIGLALADEFMALNPDVNVTYEAIGSSAGVKNANEGVTIIGTASRAIKDSEKEWGMTEHVLAFDGIAVAVNPANGVTDITMEQIQGIYKGEITNWSELGGNDEAIVVVSREDGSGTRGAFEEIVEFEGELTVDALIAEGNGNVQTTVAGNPQAIGYISFSTVDDTIKTLNVNGTVATTDNVLNGSYPVSRPFNMVFHDENMTDASNAFVDFVLSAEGQAIVEEKGGIPVN